MNQKQIVDMKKYKERKEKARELLLSIPSPTMANINLVNDLNAIEGVTVTGLDIEIKDSNAATKAHDVLEIYLTPLTAEELKIKISKWKYLFYKPYNSTMEEVMERSEVMIEELAKLPADCVNYSLNMAIKNFKIFPSYSEIYGILKPHYERRLLYQNKIITKLDQLQ